MPVADVIEMLKERLGNPDFGGLALGGAMTSLSAAVKFVGGDIWTLWVTDRRTEVYRMHPAVAASSATCSTTPSPDDTGAPPCEGAADRAGRPGRTRGARPRDQHAARTGSVPGRPGRRRPAGDLHPDRRDERRPRGPPRWRAHAAGPDAEDSLSWARAEHAGWAVGLYAPEQAYDGRCWRSTPPTTAAWPGCAS